MRKKLVVFQLFLGIIILGLVYSCSGISKATDFLTNPTAREKYGGEFEHAPELYQLWEQQTNLALKDSIFVNLPFTEAGRLFPESLPVYSYSMHLYEGEKLKVEVVMDSMETLVFLDLYRQESDSLGSFAHFQSAEYGAATLEEEVEETGIYKLIVQPEIAAETRFQLRMYKTPAYLFPVAGKGNQAIQSFWGASRDGGSRSHEGVDIFAARGTPVVATTEGRVRSTGNKGLGGKQVWLWDSKRKQSLYYAHLDSIIAVQGMRVQPGDTLGLVGNTGNARTTSPHLHFGIYKAFSGAVDPLPYVYISESATNMEPVQQYASNAFEVKAKLVNLRSGPSTKSPVLAQATATDTLVVLGKTGNWYHIRSHHGSSFIHESLVAPLGG